MNGKMMTLGAGFSALALLAGLTTVHGAGAHAVRGTAPVRPVPQNDRVSVASTMGERLANPRRAPRIPGRYTDSSTNWSGYVVNTSAAGVTEVSGTWQVPAVTAGSGCPSSDSAAWVGIDGDTDGTVEQCGTEQDTSGRYYAWYEMYPKGSALLYNVGPGNLMYADVKYNPAGGKFTLTITDQTTGQSYTTTQKLPQAQRTSAEWIMEAPWSGGVLPLADFNPFSFSACQAAVGGSSMVGLSSLSSQPINMVSSSAGAAPKAVTGPVSSNGFSVTWMACE
jgi:hypothetical protein